MRLALIALTVHEYDEAIAFFCNKLGFRLLEDTDMGGGKRWVRVQPPLSQNHTHAAAAILLARATTPEQSASVGNQTGGRVFLFLETDDLERDFTAMRSRGVTFIQEPTSRPYGRVAVFLDLYQNKWDLIEPARS
jgi:catechol 2,3-dioxygenase-like lactoylglutathione lyase family enzyme